MNKENLKEILEYIRERNQDERDNSFLINSSLMEDILMAILDEKYE
jgi:hypothetical protein